jgi:hypothetical protein
MALMVVMFLLALASWSIDIRILWLELFVFLPQRMSDLPPSSDVSTAARVLNGRLLIAQSCSRSLVVSSL